MPHVELPQAEFKVVMLGDTNTGKTSLVLRFAEGYYRQEARSATVGAFFMTKRLQVSGLTCKIQIWDTAGQAQFRAMAPMYYKNSAAAIVCYDTTNRNSYQTMRYWLDELHRNVAAGSIVICMCATKCDLEPRVIPDEEAKQLAQAMGAMWVDTSAKQNFNVTELFRRVAEQVLRFREKAKLYSSNMIPVTPGASIDEQGRVVKRGPSMKTSSTNPNGTPGGSGSPSLLPRYGPDIVDDYDLVLSNGSESANNGGNGSSSMAKPRRSRRRKSGAGGSTIQSVQSTDSESVQAKSGAVCEPMLCGALSSSSIGDRGDGGGRNSNGRTSCVIL